jgi:hypothetical protein
MLHRQMDKLLMYRLFLFGGLSFEGASTPSMARMMQA